MATPPTGDYFSFEQVLKELQIEDDDLQRLVSDGEIRAFREGEKMKFRRTDIEGLKKGRMTEPTIVLPSESEGSEQESQVLVVGEDNPENSNIEHNELQMDDSSVMTDGGEIADENEQKSELMLVLNEGEEQSKTSGDENLDFGSESSSDGGLIEQETFGSEPPVAQRKDITQELQYEEESGSYASTALSKDNEGLEDFNPSGSQSADLDMKFDGGEATGSTTEPLDGFIEERPKTKRARAKETSPSEEQAWTEPLQQPIDEEQPAEQEAVPRRPLTRRASTAVVEQETFNPVLVFFLVAATILLLVSGMFIVNAIFDVDHAGTSWMTRRIK